ncbi:ADP-ribosylation factor-like protein 13B, partial [Centruroides sculpturatus]|uniref:ADP-ribosylation factor-like protein 13B n=1 Tax=Centruroides sculpturatus TaxID=218467 RepID=UPI000C6ED6A5
ILESTEDVVPTVGFSSVQVKHNQFDITIFDLGGGHKIRGIWKNYYASVYGIIFVMDASEAERIDECRKEITVVLQDPRISGKPMLLLVNKQDVQGAMDETEICNLLELENMVNKQECPTRVETCSAISINSKKRDKGIDKGFQWLVGHIEKYYKELEQRVQKETNEQKEREEKERLERMERVRKIREEREKQEAEAQNNVNNDGGNDEDDDDVIVGSPFKPASKIRVSF